MRKAEVAARELIEQKFPVHRYEDVQSMRRERLKKFTEIGIPAMIKAETDLIAWGEEVLKLLKEHEQKNS